MEIVAVGWERKRNQNVIAKRDLLTAKVGVFDSYSSSQTYITMLPQESELNSATGRYQQVQNAQLAIRFNAPIVLNGNYLLRSTLDKREVAHLFFMLHEDCSFEEIVRMFNNYRALQRELRALRNEDVPQFERLMFKRVDELEFSVRAAGCLKNDGVVYLGDLVQKTEAEMLQTPNYGRKSLDEIKDMLARLNLSLGMKLKNWPPKNVESWSKVFENAD